jgi:MFS family permease
MGSVGESHDFRQLMGVDSNPQTDRDAAAYGGIVAVRPSASPIQPRSIKLTCCSAVGQVYYGGTLIGALLGGILGDRIGRLKCITIASVLATLGACVQASSFGITQMMIGRVITGLGRCSLILLDRHRAKR